MSNMLSAVENKGACFESLFDKTSDAAFVVDARTRVVHGCNQAAEQVFGLPREDLIGHSTEQLYPNAEAFQRFADIPRRALEHGGVYATRCNFRCKDGNVYPARVRVVPIDMSDYSDFVLSLVRVETEPSAYVRSLEDDLVRVSTAAESAEDKWAVVIERLAAEIDWDYGERWWFHAGRLTMSVHWPPEALSPRILEGRRATHFEPGDGLPGRVHSTLQPEWLTDPGLESMPFSSWVAFPVHHNDLEVDVLVFASRKERVPDEQAVKLLQRAVEGMVHLLARPNGTEIDRETQRNFANLCRLHPLPIWVCDVRTLHILDVNDAALASTGYEETELKGKTFIDLIDSVGADALAHHLPVPDSKAQRIGAVSIAKKDGTFADLYLQMLAVDWNGHETFAMLGINSNELAPWLLDAQGDSLTLEERLRSLTRREKQVLDSVMAGKSNHEISQGLELSPRTIEVYRASMMRKMGARSATHLLSMLTFTSQV